jgi:UDP-N-acetylglucosamine acyltransferase
VVIQGRTICGEENEIFPFASVGAAPQDLKYAGEESELILGDRNTVREFATVHPGTRAGGMVTRIGNDNLLMNYSHVAHDCVVGDRNVIANGVQLGGHVVVENWTVVGALSGIHQFVRLGESALVGAGSMVSKDVPPFCNATGDRARLIGLNTVGLKRRGMDAGRISAIKRAYRVLFRSGLRTTAAVARVRDSGDICSEVERLLAFLEASQRGVCR